MFLLRHFFEFHAGLLDSIGSHLHNPNNDEVCWTLKDDLGFFMVSFSANAIMFDHVALDIGLLCHFMVSSPVFH